MLTLRTQRNHVTFYSEVSLRFTDQVQHILKYLEML